MTQVSIGSIVRNFIMQNPTMKNGDILTHVKPLLPLNAKTTVACVAWYKNEIKKKGLQQVVEVARTSQIVAEEIANLQEELQMLQEQEQEEVERNKEQLLQQFEELKNKLGL